MRDRRDHQREPDPEHVTQHAVGKAECNAGAEDQRDRQRKADAAGIERGKAFEQHVNQRRQRQHQVPARDQRMPGARDLRALHADQTVLAGFKMHHPERGGEIEHRGDHRGLDDDGIIDAQGLRHDEGDRTHHRRHDLSAHRGGGLDAGGEGAAIAEPDHQRDRELADGDDIGDAGARDRSHHAGGEHRDLGGATAGAAEQAKRNVGEQLDHPGALEERAEQDEQEDVGRRDVDRHAVKAFGAVGEVGNDLVEIIAAMVERRRQMLAEEPVENARPAHQRQRETHQPPRTLENQNRKQRPDREIEPGRIAVARDQVGIKDPLIQPAQESGAPDQPAGGAPGIALGGEIADQPKGHQDQEADVNAAHHLARQHVPGRDDQLKGRECDADGIGQMSPAARAEALRKSMFEIIEFDLDGRFCALSVNHPP